MRHRLVVAAVVILPLRRLAAVVEARRAVEVHLHLSVHTANRPQQHVLRVVVRRRAPVRVRPISLVMPRPDQQDVAHDDPPAAGAPARLEDVRPGEVTPGRRHEHAVRTEAERPRVAVEDRAEDARRVEPRQAQPLDAAARGDQRTGLAIGEEPVVRDRWERARRRAKQLTHAEVGSSSCRKYTYVGSATARNLPASSCSAASSYGGSRSRR